MDAAELLNRHLPVVELRAFDVLAQFAHHELLVERLGFGEARGVDSVEDLELLLGVLDLLRNCFRRVVTEAIVVAGVTDVGRKLRIGAKGIFPLGLQGVTKLRAAGVERGFVGLAGKRDGEGAHEGCNGEQSHVEDLEVERRE